MGFPKCHVLRSKKSIVEMVVVPKAGQWEKITNIVGDPVTETNKDYKGADDMYDSKQSAYSFMTPGSQSDLSFESMEDVSEEDIKKLKDEILGK